DADRRKDEFLAMLGHELRNPLTPLQGAVEALRRGHLENAAIEKAYAMMDRQVVHLRRLVDDLLDVSRITRGLIDIRREPVNLAEVVGTAVEMINPTVEARKQQLQVTQPSRPLRVNGDTIRLTQIVFNLLHNATRYTEPGGHIGLSVESEGGQAIVRVR